VPGLFAAVSGRGAAAAETGDRSILQALLDVEAALARAGAAAGVVPAAAAEQISAACVADRFDLDALGREAAGTGTVVVPLVRALTAVLPDPAAHYVHTGATSQDVLDTAAMLVAHRALPPLLADLAAAADRCAELAEEHRGTLLAGRTLLQQALPVTFGGKVAGWLVGLDEARGWLAEVADRTLAVQLGGAAGTLASLGPAGPAVVAGLARELGLAEPTVPWHTLRQRPAMLAGALGTAAGVVGKIAGDLVLLAATEVGEVREAAGGGSSTLPHKHNPVAAVAALSCTERVPGLVATMLAAMRQEHERAAGSWQAEWETLPQLLRLVGSAAGWLRDALTGLQVDAARMRANLERTGGLLMSEAAATALARTLGPRAAHHVLTEAARGARAHGRALREVLLADPEVRRHLTPADLDAVLDPAGYLGATAQQIDRALRAHEEAR
jgi:3-carboxy-cis,cis-muconate cycloisomerase